MRIRSLSDLATSSLVWTVLRNLFLAFVVVYALLLAWILYSDLKRSTEEVDRYLNHLSTTLVSALDEDAANRTNAQDLIVFLRRVMNTNLSYTTDLDLSNTSNLYFYVGTLDGSFVDAPVGGPTLDFFRVPLGLSEVSVDNKLYRVYGAQGVRWKVLIADKQEVRLMQAFSLIGIELALYVLAAAIIAMSATLLSLRSALRSLTSIAGHLISRNLRDTEVLTLTSTYRELQPVIDALNRLFQRVASSVTREKSFVQDAAHELRTPLAVIATEAHVLAHSVGEARVLARQRLGGAVERASHLAQKLLEIARADASIAPVRQQFDLMSLIRDILAAFAATTNRTEAEISLDGPDVFFVMSDPQRLRSILENLIDNALRYGGSSVQESGEDATRPAGEAVVEVRVSHEADMFRVVVLDNGSGVPSQFRQQAFERFWRAPGIMQNGAGLGLAIVRESVLALGGDVSITDGDNGSGCAVVVRLPVANTSLAELR
jgi:two-component system, OmpR family, sensor histidine kinase QseC